MRPRTGYNREHLYEPGFAYDSFDLPRKVRNSQHHIGHIPIIAHDKMNCEIHPSLAVMSNYLCRQVLDFVSHEQILHPEERWRTVEKEELFLRRLGVQKRTQMVGREAIYFADALELKLSYWRPQ